MDTMSTPESIFWAREPIRPLKRREYACLAAEGFFENERVELLFGMVVPMTPTDPPHSKSGRRLRQILERQLGERAEVCNQDPFAASDISEPQPDVMVIPLDESWNEHPSHAFLVVEVANSSLRKDREAKRVLYGLAAVDEYWIVNLVDQVVEVHRDPTNGEFCTKLTYQRGDTIAMVAFPDVIVAVSDILPPAE